MKLLCLTFSLVVSAITSWAANASVARISATRTDISSFTTALKMFDVDCGRYPTTAEGLDALINRPSNVPPGKWHKYLDIDKTPLDPWGHAYVYRCPGVHNTNTFDIYSCGPAEKSKSGGDDPYDINNWNPSSPLDSPAQYESLHRQKVRCLFATAFCFLVLAGAWLNGRTRKSEGNLHGILALLWLAATPVLWMVFQNTVAGKSVENNPLAAIFGWLTVLLVLTISADRRGTPFSKNCGRLALVFLLLLVFWLLFPPLGLLFNF